MPTLTVVGGLPGTGKSTIAHLVAKRRLMPFLRVDRIEHAIVAWSSLSHPVGPAGYAVAHALAAEQLQLGLDVLVECVNPTAVTRDAWVGTASTAGAALLEVEVTCSDQREHQRRLATRGTDVEGLVKPTWSAVTAREYEPWDRPRLLVDTAVTPPDEAAAQIVEALRHGATVEGSLVVTDAPVIDPVTLTWPQVG